MELVIINGMMDASISEIGKKIKCGGMEDLHRLTADGNLKLYSYIG